MRTSQACILLAIVGLTTGRSTSVLTYKRRVMRFMASWLLLVLLAACGGGDDTSKTWTQCIDRKRKDEKRKVLAGYLDPLESYRKLKRSVKTNYDNLCKLSTFLVVFFDFMSEICSGVGKLFSTTSTTVGLSSDYNKTNTV